MTEAGDRAAAWTLRVTFAVMGVGLGARWIGVASPIAELLVDRFGVSPGFTARIDEVGFALLVVAAALLPTRWFRIGLVWTSAWVVALTVATTARDPDAPAMVAASHAVRWLAPIALLWWLDDRGAPRPELRGRALLLLRAAAAATFIGHGLGALGSSDRYVDLLLVAHRRFLGADMALDSAHDLLRAIGVLDVAVAVLLLTTRWRAVAAWMALWGAVTAASRIVHSGFGSYAETLLRAPNAGVALALFFAWRRPADPEAR